RATLEIGSGRVGAKQLALNVDRQIADPAGHSDKVLVGAYRPVDEHHGRRPCPVLLPEPAPQISAMARTGSTVLSAPILSMRSRPSSKEVRTRSTCACSLPFRVRRMARKTAIESS